MCAAAGGIDFTEGLVANDRQVESTDGSVELRWIELPPDSRVELVQASTAEFSAPVQRYLGTDPASMITGLPEGIHYFRVRSIAPSGPPGPWSKSLEVTVAFMDRGHLFLLLGLGGSVVILTAGAIIAGHLGTRHAK